MIAVRSKILFLVACIAEVSFLLIAQVIGNTLLLLPCLGLFTVIVAFSAIKGMAIPVILFFMPFAPLLKLQPGTISFFTVALLVVYIIYIVLGIRNINIYHLIPGLCLIAMALVVRTLYGYSVDNSFILFSASLLMIPFVSRELDGKYDFYWLMVFFSLGIVIAAITAKYLTVFPTITRYIDTNVFFGIIRRSGYYGDPNFYSAHITAALSGALLLLLNNNKNKRVFVAFILVAALIYCGLLSVSKSFVLVAICFSLFWLVEFMFKKGRLSAKLMIILTFSVGVVFFLSSTVFTDLIGMTVSRFSGGNSTWSDFTTGRTDLWLQYFSEFGKEPLLFIFGKGFSPVLVNDRASHNTVIQIIYQFGIIGCVLLFSWIFCYVRTLLGDAKVRWSHMTQIFIVLIGSIGPWMALDLLFSDEFFIIPIYVCVAIRFISTNRITNEVQLTKKNYWS